MEHILNRGRILFWKCRAESIDPGRIGTCHHTEPVLYQFIKQFAYLPIWYPQSEYIRICLLHMCSCQVACSIEYAPHVFRTVIDIAVCQFLFYAFCYPTAV